MQASPETIAAVAFVIGFAAGWLLRGGTPASPAQPSASAPVARVPPAQALGDAELLRLVRGGNKIEAIKRYRAMTGSELKDAKDAVDRLAGG